LINYKTKENEKIFLLAMITVMEWLLLVQETTKKVKATTAKMAKVDGAGMALFQKLLIMVQLHTTQMDNANLFY
jgi:hypothetical protein